MTEITIIVIDLKGQSHELVALTGWRLMEVLRDYEMGVVGECGGALSCATCHVYVDPVWASRLAYPCAEEQDRLDHALGVKKYSRLSCQIILGPEHQGLKVTIAPN